MAPTGVLRALGRLLGRVPPRALAAIGASLAWLHPLFPRRARVCARNIALAFPALDAHARRRLARRSLASNITGGLETLVAWFAPRLGGRADVHGLEVLDDALRDGGVLLVAAHYDSLELAIRAVAEAARARSGTRLAALARPYNDPRLQAAVEAGRGRYLAVTIDKKHLRGLIGAVQGGAAVVYAADQDASRANAFVPFFGVPAATFTALPGLLRHVGGRVVTMWSRRGADGRLRVDLAAPPAGLLDGDGTVAAAAYMAWIERRLDGAPEQYLWVHRRFKTRPPGTPDRYASPPG